jgi:DNA-binding NarL/FixJ family response regulator
MGPAGAPTAGHTVIRVVLADDQELVRTGFRLILSAEPDVDVVGEAADGVSAVDIVRRLRPDVTLMDVRMPRADGIEATRRITHYTRVVMLTTFDLDEYVYAALRAGASGFLLKTAPAASLVEAVRTVANGDALLAPSITRRLIAEFARRPQPASGAGQQPVQRLTAREAEVLRLLARGHSNTEISHTLVIEPTTVKSHVANVLAKLGARDRVQAVIYAYESGFIQPGHTEPPRQ